MNASGISELPVIAVPAGTVGGRRTAHRSPLRSMLAILGAVGLTAGVVAPATLALSGGPAAVADETYNLVLSDAQSLTIDPEVGAEFSPSARGAFTVYVKPKPKPVARVASAPKYSGGGSKQEWLRAAGIAESDWGYVDYIVKRESGWNPNAVNKKSGASGLVQALPCSKVPGSCFNPVDNLRWADRYAKSRYGSWEGAYSFWTRKHWW